MTFTRTVKLICHIILFFLTSQIMLGCAFVAAPFGMIALLTYDLPRVLSNERGPVQPILAAREGDLSTIKSIIKSEKYSEKKYFWDQAAVEAVNFGQVEALKLLIDAGVDRTVLSQNINDSELIAKALCKSDYKTLDYLHQIGFDLKALAETKENKSYFESIFVHNCQTYRFIKGNVGYLLPKITLKDKFQIIDYLVKHGFDFSEPIKSSVNNLWVISSVTYTAKGDKNNFYSPATIALMTNQWALAQYLDALTSSSGASRSTKDFKTYSDEVVTQSDRLRLLEIGRQEDADLEATMVFVAYYNQDHSSLRAIIDLLSPQRRVEIINRSISKHSMLQGVRIESGQEIRWANDILYLVDQGNAVHTTDKDDNSFLDIATTRMNNGLIEQLLARGAESVVNLANQYGRTPIFSIRDRDAMVLLLKAGADINHIDKNGDTVFLVRYGSSELKSVTIDDFINAGLKVNYRNPKTGWTALGKAADRGNHGSVQKLIAAGAEVNQLSFKNKTACQLAADKYKELKPTASKITKELFLFLHYDSHSEYLDVINTLTKDGGCKEVLDTSS
ncbi:MAG: hypothetical protein QM523_04595 [Candidatus Pacebacteria bacterium]|nr:hypothetical protein [Candidatus Paceibacterota bacterium]